jgi:thioredoxin:protein disulfide reductase
MQEISAASALSCCASNTTRWPLSVMSVFSKIIGVLLMALFIAGAQANAEDELLAPEKAFVFNARMVGTQQLELNYRIAPGYYMYRERFEVSSDAQGDSPLGTLEYPKGKIKYDPSFEKDMEIYEESVTLQVSLLSGASQPFMLSVKSQGCADAGICYPPMENTVTVTPVAGGYAAAGAPAATPTFTAKGWFSLLTAGDVGLADAIGGLGWLKTAGVFLALGMLLALTPCVLPMVPILSAIVVGAQTNRKPSRWRGLGLAAAYVAGMSVVYTALGIAAGLSGAGLAAWLQKPWVLSLFATVLLVLALAMFGAFSFQMPNRIQSWLVERVQGIPGERGTGAAIMGAVSALIVGPCVAAPLAGALLYISQTGDVLLGSAALFALAWGMGVPLLVVGGSSSALLPKAGPWMEGIKRLFGLLLLATAWWMVMFIMPSWLLLLSLAFLVLVAAVMLGAFEALPAMSGTLRMFMKAMGILLVLLAAIWLIAMASGGRSVWEPLAHLKGAAKTDALTTKTADEMRFRRVRSSAELSEILAQSKQPVMLDFYADWCVSCREMEHFTFSDAQVGERMSRMVLVQADVTDNNEKDRELLKRFRLYGPPGIMFFEPGGKEISDVRVIGYMDAKRFIDVLDKVLQRVK